MSTHFCLELQQFLNLLLWKQVSLGELSLQFNSLSQESWLLRLQSPLLDIKVANDLLQVTDTLMQRVLCIGLCGHFSLVLVLFARQILLDIILFLEALLQIMRCWILILHQLLLILVELQDVAIEHLDFVEWNSLNLRQIFHQLIIIHLKVAQVAHTEFLWVFLGKLALLITANHTNRPGAFLAVSDWIPVEPNSAGEGSLT